jgi:hypothetical protein
MNFIKISYFNLLNYISLNLVVSYFLQILIDLIYLSDHFICQKEYNKLLKILSQKYNQNPYYPEQFQLRIHHHHQIKNVKHILQVQG